MRVYRVTLTLVDGSQVMLTMTASGRKQARRAARYWAAEQQLEVATAQAECAGRYEPVLTEAGDEIDHAIGRLLVDADDDMKQRIAAMLGE